MPLKYFKKKAKRAPLRKYRPKYTRKSSAVTASAVRKIVKSVTAKKAESKRYGTAVWDQFVGQVDNNSAGYLTLDVTPLLSVGTGQSARIGNAIDWVSAHYQFQVMEQSTATNTDVAFKFMLIHDKNPSSNVYTTQDANNPIEFMYSRNNFIRTSSGSETTIRDYSSQRDLDHMSRFRILATKNIFMKGDQIASSSQRIRTFSMGLKFRNPMKQKYAGTSSVDYISSSAGAVFLCVFCNSGNIGNTVSTLDGIPREAISSGYLVSMNSKSYFKDY